jgi:hypothetical protein
MAGALMAEEAVVPTHDVYRCPAGEKLEAARSRQTTPAQDPSGFCVAHSAVAVDTVILVKGFFDRLSYF